MNIIMPAILITLISALGFFLPVESGEKVTGLQFGDNWYSTSIMNLNEQLSPLKASITNNDNNDLQIHGVESAEGGN
jgi:hypothetical protein